jgi:formylglycine-generating enzyme required for sulfatase activity
MKPLMKTGQSIGSTHAIFALTCLFATVADLGYGQSAAPVATPATDSVPPSDTSPIPAPPLTDAQKAMLTGKIADNVSELATKTGIKLVPIPAGTFLMGSPSRPLGLTNELPLTKVTITKSFWLGKCTVTQGQWETLMGTDVVEQARRRLGLADDNDPKALTGSAGPRPPAHATPPPKPDAISNPMALIGNVGDDYPIYCVTWGEAVAFCRKLTEQERTAKRLPPDYEYRLPTEAEWEYACRAGTTEETYAGKLKMKDENNAPMLDAIAWYSGNSSVGYTGHGFSTELWPQKQYPGGEAGPREVGGKLPNAWGLYDMVGNVKQWCSDWYFYALPGGVVTDPAGPASGSFHVSRGSCWFYGASCCRSAYRGGYIAGHVLPWPGDRDNYTGFRVALGPVR